MMGSEGAWSENQLAPITQKFNINGTGTLFYPTPSPNPAIWFETNSGNPYICSTYLNNFCGNSPDASEDGCSKFSDFQIQVATGQYVSTIYDPVINYTIQHDMLSKAWRNSSVVSNSGLTTWWQANQGSNVGLLARQNHLGRNLFRFDSTERATIDQCLAQIQGLRAQYRQLDSLLEAGYADPQIQIDMNWVLNELCKQDSILILTHSSQRIDDIALLAQLESINNSIAANGEPAINEQLVNGHQYSIWYSQPDTLANYDYLALRVIAEKCPAESGNSVFAARNLLNNYGLYYETNDTNCGDLERNGGQTPLEPKRLMAYPNPNNGTVFISYHIEKPTIVTIFQYSVKSLAAHLGSYAAILPRL
jgi:hypothetical protein